jgi:hypothetical protein
MTKHLIAEYTRMLNQACLINDPHRRAKKIGGIIQTIRQDKNVPALTLCAFLQDNARIIREMEATK